MKTMDYSIVHDFFEKFDEYHGLSSMISLKNSMNTMDYSP